MSARRRAIGAEVLDRGVDFRVWAPDHRELSVVVAGRDFPLDREEDGYFRAIVAEAHAGTRYRFRIDGAPETYPDPASRYQPEGPHGPSEVVDPRGFRWHEFTMPRERVLYEMHIGTFTLEGTWRAAAGHFQELVELGITVIEVMPVNEFAGRFGWGYDGVDLWAPSHLYGRPDDFRSFIDAAHAAGLGVILDVVYNHFGPDGCYVQQFAGTWFSKERRNEWGDTINFDGAGSCGVREFFAENAAYWIDEYRLDGLRLDATQSIVDRSQRHIIRQITDRARNAAAGRPLFITAENEKQGIRLLKEFGVDALWNDDWHHSAMVAVTGHHEAYYSDYRGRPQEFVSLAKHGFLYQGQRYSWQKQRRGTPSLDLTPDRFICYAQNHDQVANSVSGARLHQRTSPGRFRALAALLLLGPQTPLLFQGQEFAASAPFLYFADHKPELADAVAKGRREFLAQFPSIVTIAEELPRPDEAATFTRCKLDHGERLKNAATFALHRDLLRLRREIPPPDRIDGAVLGEEAFLIRYLREDGDDRLLLVNFGRDLALDVAPEPLLAPPLGARWALVWSSESPEYGGAGTAAIERDAEPSWVVAGQAAVLMRPGELGR